MAVAFSEKEQDEIRQALKAEGRRCAVATGVKKTTVEQLAQAAEISKGAFYKFYESKELLFFEILEDLHTEIYQAAANAFLKDTALPAPRRAANAILAACNRLETSGMMDFMERDVHYILRKMPTDVLDAYYHNDEAHIRALLERAGLQPVGGVELAAATVRGLMLTVSHRADIGPLYPQVLKNLVEGVCEKLFLS